MTVNSHLSTSRSSPASLPPPLSPSPAPRPSPPYLLSSAKHDLPHHCLLLVFLLKPLARVAGRLDLIPDAPAGLRARRPHPVRSVVLHLVSTPSARTRTLQSLEMRQSLTCSPMPNSQSSFLLASFGRAIGLVLRHHLPDIGLRGPLPADLLARSRASRRAMDDVAVVLQVGIRLPAHLGRRLDDVSLCF